jgi:cell wall assembly regulator SMI1
MTTDLVDSSWDRIDAWLRERAPATFATLNGPATAGDIAAAESRLGVGFMVILWRR